MTFTVYKSDDDTPRWVSISSTAYRDSDEQFVSCKALDGAVEIGDTTGYRGPLRFWHVPGWDFGDCDFQMTDADGRVLIESGTFRDPAYAEALKERGQGYQMSIGFTHSANEPDPDGVFHHIAVFERSLVPAGRAANPWTAFTPIHKEAAMTKEEKEAQGRLLFGDKWPQVMDQALQTDKAAQTAGASFKSTDAQEIVLNGVTYRAVAKEAEAATEPAAQVETPATEQAPQPDIAAILQATFKPLGEQITALTTRLDTMASTTQKEASDRATLTTTVQGIDKRLKELEGDQPASGGYRASQDKNTITTNEALKQAKPDWLEDTVNGMFSGAPAA